MKNKRETITFGIGIAILIFMLVMIGFTVTSKEHKTNKNNQRTIKENMQKQYSDSENRIYVYVDPETGVNYLCYVDKTNAGCGITVRLNKWGEPYISKIEE